MPSINVIRREIHASDGRVELDARKGKRDFMESGLEKCGFEDSGLLLDRRIPRWQKDINGESLCLMQPVENTGDASRHNTHTLNSCIAHHHFKY